MRVVFDTTHNGSVGGGENYGMRFAMALDQLCDLYVVRNWHPDFIKNNGFGKEFKTYNGLFEPDMYIHCSHFVCNPMLGRRNYSVSFFPKRQLAPGEIEGVVAICDYSAVWVRNYWGRTSAVIEPCVDTNLFSSSPKELKIVSIGHFFEESDGHSKNQHVLADAFSLSEEGYELVLIGNSNQGDESYLDKVKRSGRGKRVRVEINKDHAFIKAELASASHLWHANGYGRSDPAQTEHFGIIALEAIASGVVPIVHNSGGCRDIVGVTTWERPEDLNQLTRTVPSVCGLDRRYSVEQFNSNIEKWLVSL